MKLLATSCRIQLPLLCVALLMLAIASASIGACEENKSPMKVDFVGHSFAFYALSRGQGVPDDTWQALEQLRAWFADMQSQGEIVQLHDDRIGLEGEVRLCAEFATTAIAQSAWEQASQLIQTLELKLFNLKIESCK